MICALCGTRKARRACPALGRSICPVCCGTKRLKEIACPPSCVYLASTHAHPPAVVQRQRERDLPFIVQLIEGMTAAQGDILSLLQARIRAHRATAIPAIQDADVQQAVSTLAATLETAARGILYEHQTTSVPALRLQQDLRAALAELGERERAPGPAVLAVVLRRLEQIGQRIGALPDANATSFLDFLDRLGRARGPREAEGAEDARPSGAAEAPPSRIILP